MAKHRFRFGLRSLLLLVVLAAVPCGYFSWNAKHFAAVKALIDAGHDVQWSRETPSWLDGMMGVYRFDSVHRIEINGTYTDLSPIANLHSLKEFRSDYTLHADFSPLIPHADSLRVFSMYDCPSEAAEFLKMTTGLEEFSGNTWSGIDLACLAGNRNLKVLYVTDAEGLEHLSKFTELEYLQAPRDLDTLDRIRDMKKLEHLDFSGSRVTSLEPLKELKALKYVNFEEVPVPQSEIDAFLSSLPSDVEAYGSSWFPDDETKAGKD